MTSENPIAEHDPTQNASGKSDAETGRIEPNVGPTSHVSNVPPTQQHCQVTCKTEKNWWDKIKPFVEILGIGLLSIYTAYTIKMYCANKRAADAATIAANTAEKSMRLAYAPRIIILGVSPDANLSDHRLHAFASLTNMGGLQAESVRWFVLDNVGPIGNIQRSAYVEFLEAPKFILPGPSRGQGLTGNRTLSKKEIAGLKSGDLGAIFSVLIEYRDEFSPKPHHVEFCSRYTLKNSIVYNGVCPWSVQND